jgi:hypothetical protein
VDDATASPAKMSTATNNVGILQTIYGKVTNAYVTGEFTGYFYVDDGSGIQDGSGSVGVMCRPIDVLFFPGMNDYVSVTGVMGVRQINGRNARYLWSTAATGPYAMP